VREISTPHARTRRPSTPMRRAQPRSIMTMPANQVICVECLWNCLALTEF
jgi:hypothetical protein